MAGKPISGVYLIRNLKNKKVYVGASKDIKARMSRHRKLLKRNQHKNPELQKDWNLCDRLDFDFSILELTPPEALLERESYWIKFYTSLDPDKGYNYWIPDNSLTGRDKKEVVKAPKTKYYLINKETKEILFLNSAEIKIKLRFERNAVSATSRYWRGALKVTKSYKGWIIVNELDYNSDFDYVKFDKLIHGRLPIVNRKKNYPDIIKEEKASYAIPILMKHVETGEEIICKSSREAIRNYNLTPTKLLKCLNAPFGKYKHHNYHIKRYFPG